MSHSSHIAGRVLVAFVAIATAMITADAQASAGSLSERPYSVSADGKQLVVGTPWLDDYSGAAYVLQRKGDTWVMGQELSAPGMSGHARFGSAVAIDGDYIAVGAPWHDLFRGAVLIFERSGGKWQLRQTVTLTGAPTDSRFGSSIAMSDGVLVIASAEGDGRSAAYRYERREGQWIQTRTETRGLSIRAEAVTDAGMLSAFDLVIDQAGAAPDWSLAADDTLQWVTASDAVFEDRVEVKWSPVDASAILYKILRNGVLIAAASSDDSLYNDTTGDRGVTYNYCVVVQDMQGGETTPKCNTGSRVIRAPVHLAASDGQFIDGVHLTWEDRSEVESGFYVRRNAALIATLARNRRTYTDSSAVALTVYTYEVLAFDDDADESGVDTDDGFRGVVLPPLDVQASDGQYANSVKVTWVDQGDETGFVITRKNLTTMSAIVLDTTATNIQQYVDNTAQLGVRYQYCVKALDGGGQLSVPVCDDGGVDLVAPANVAASDSTFDDRVQIKWEDASGIASGYHIWRDGAPLDTVGASVRTYDDRDASANVTHTYCVAAFNSNGGLSAQSCNQGFRMIVMAPANVQASDGAYEGHTQVKWESTSTTVALFKIFRDGVFIKSVGSGSRVYDDEGGTAGQEYTYSVQAFTGTLVASTTASDTGRRELKVPINVRATDDTFEDRVEISWRDLSAVETGFVIYRIDTVTAVVDSIGQTGANTASFVDRTGTPGKTYQYGVAAYDINGEGKGESERSKEDYGIRTLLPPISVDATDGQFEDRVEITWADKSGVEDGYRIYRNGVLILSTPDNVTSIFDNGPQFGLTNEYSVRAFDAYGTSLADADNGSTMVLAPASLNASDTYDDRIELRWVDVSGVEAGYVLRTDSATVMVHVDTLGVGATFFTDDNALPGVVYTYRLHAFAGSAVSPVVSDTGVRPVDAGIPTNSSELLKLNPSDPALDDRFGASVAINEDAVVVIGAPQDDIPGAANGGSAYIFALNAQGEWKQRAKLTHTNILNNDHFGQAVAISGRQVIVGADADDYAAQYANAGRVFFYAEQDTGSWANAGNLFASDPATNVFLGTSVGISGDAAIAGAPGALAGAGKAYIFEKVATTWTQKQIFQGSHGPIGDFGRAVAIDGDWAVVGTPNTLIPAGEDSTSAVYVFKRGSNGVWSAFPGGPLTPSNRTKGMLPYPNLFNNGQHFGRSVSISGGRVVIGTDLGPGYNGTAYMSGAYVFEFDAASQTWIERAILTPRDGNLALFGKVVSISGDRIVVESGAYFYPAPGQERAGMAYLFVRNADGEWIEEEKFASEEAAQFATGNADYNDAIAVSSAGLVVGAMDDTEFGNDAGAVFVAELRKPANVTASDGTFDGLVRVVWEDHSRSEAGFVVYRDGIEHARVGASVEFYDDTEAQPGRAYEYAVASIGAVSRLISERGADFGWRPPNGHITGRVTSQTGFGVADVSVCLEPSPTRALLLDGAGGHVLIRDDGAFNFATSTDFTVEMWFSYAGVDRSPRLISKKPQNGLQERPLDLGLQRSGRLFFTMSDGTTVARVLSQRSDLSDDAWHHVACVHDAATHELTLYIDGVQEDSASTSALGDITNDGDVFIGGYEDSTWFGGQIDELRIWTTPRTPAEIEGLMRASLSGSENSLGGYWSFDEFEGEIVTDLVAEPQYGVLVGGVYRTDKVAPISVCGTTESDGSFALANLRYEENGTNFKLRPSLGERQFSPAVQPVTLNRGNPVENQIVFADISSHDVIGTVQFAGTNCFEPNVEIRVDGFPAGVTDKNGKFTVMVAQGVHTIRARFRDYDFDAVFMGDTLSTDSLTIDVTDDVENLVFLNQSTFSVTGVVGGGCDRYVGEVSIRFRSENNCVDTTFVGNPDYALDLPPMRYFASASVDRETIPESLVRPDVISFFENLGEREVNLVADTDSTIIDDRLDFIYRAPLRVTLVGFEPFVDPDCQQLTLEDGTPLPAGLPIIPQGTFVPLEIQVEEVYGDSVCPLDTGMVVIFDEIADRQNDPDTLIVSNGQALLDGNFYRTFASTPSLVRGRTEGTKDRSFQKLLEVRTLVDGRSSVSKTTWVVVTGHVAPEGAEFVTVPTTPVPLVILRDPPGDGSYAYWEKGETGCARIHWGYGSVEVGAGAAWDLRVGATTELWAGVGAGFIKEWMANTQTRGKVIVGGTSDVVGTIDVCVTTTERVSTSAEEDFIGENGDVYVGAGFTYLFAEVGVIEVDGCTLEQTTSVGFEPEKISTAYAFTEQHILDTLIPELESKMDYYHVHGDEDSVRIFRQMRNEWLEQIETNRLDKISRTDEVVEEPISPFEDVKKTKLDRKVKNRSFSAGTEYEFTSTSDTTTVVTMWQGVYIHSEAELGWWVGLANNAEFRLGVVVELNGTAGSGSNVDTTRTTTIGYVISDDDVGDGSSVDIVYPANGWGVIFDVLGGRSSCPYEPWLDQVSEEPTMVQRDQPKIFIDPKERFAVPPDKPATFKVTIANLSNERRDYVVKAVSSSNPGGAIMRLNGVPISDEPVFWIDGVGQGVNAHEATLTVERGPSRFNYERLALVVEPVCGGDAFAERTDLYTIDSLFFDVSFEGCSDITMRGPDVEPGWVYNHADSAAGKQLDVVLDGYELVINPSVPNVLDAVGIQYRHMGVDRDGPGPWIDIREIPPGIVADISYDGSPDTLMVWRPDSLSNGGYAPLSDGVYELRAYTVCSAGGRGYSEASKGTIDRHAPVVFGTPQPADGQLSLGEDIGITFNEPLDCDRVADATVTLEYVDGPLMGQMIAVTPVCNGKSIILVPQVNPVDLDGRRLEASVGGVVDRAGNVMTATVTWRFDYRRSLFTWSQTRITQQAALVTPGSVTAQLVNGTDQAVDYAVTSVPAFLTVQSATGRLAPGGSKALVFDIDPAITGGIHEGQVAVQAVNTAGTDTVAVATLDVVLDVSCAAPNWTIDATKFEHSMSMVCEVQTDDGVLTDGSDRLAAFVGEQLRGLASPRAVAGDTLVFLTVFSNRLTGELVRFEVWDDNQCRRYRSTAERAPFNADDVLGTTLVPMILTAMDAPPATVASFPLESGWNWFSTNMVSGDMSVGAVLSSLAPTEGDVVKSKTAFAVFDPDSLIGWIGSLTTFDNTSGYMIRLTEAGTILQEGTFADPTTTPVPVDNGWNWIGYVPNDNQTVGTALADLGTGGLLNGNEIVRAQTAFAEWNAGWFGSLETMGPGRGYRLYLQDPALPASFYYPAGTLAPAAVAVVGRAASGSVLQSTTPGWQVNAGLYEHNMTLVATVEQGGSPWRDVNLLVGAFVGDECRGFIRAMQVPGIEDYLAFATIHSNAPTGETVGFRVFDATRETTYDVKQSIAFDADLSRGTVRDPFVLTALSTPRSEIPTVFRLAQNFPNPFNPQTTIRFDLPRASSVTIRIFNVAGQEVRTLIQRNYPAGSYTVPWNGETSSGGEAASGVYFYQLRAGAFVDTKKMVLLR